MANQSNGNTQGTGAPKLFDLAVAALKQDGWAVQRVADSRKSSERMISKKGKTLRVTIRTSRDHWLAFPMKDADGTQFGPLATADRVVVATPDPDDSAYALVFDFPADDIRKRFDKALAARTKAGHAVRKQQHGMWVSLFQREGEGHPIYTVGGGVAREYKPFARLPIDGAVSEQSPATLLSDLIATAKRKIAAAAGIDPSQVRISIEA